MGGERPSHAISKLIIRKCKLDTERALKNTFLNKVIVDFYMFGASMQNRIGS